MNYSFTIVIPAYNAELYISSMIESIINQTYGNWNLIIVDDGSKDNTGTICDTYQNDRIQVIHTDNQGQAKARAVGIEKATGDYTLVVDADDEVTNNCLERINDVLNNSPYDMVMFPYMECDKDLKPTNKTSVVPKHQGKMSQREVISWVISTYNHGLVNKAIKTSLIKKGALESTKKRLKVNGDYALIIPILCQIKSAYFYNEAMYLYRIHGTSISHNISFQHILDTDYVSEMVKEELVKYELYDDKIRELVNQAYLHMIVMMLGKLANKEKISKSKLIELKSATFYTESLAYEKKEKFTLCEYLSLKSLRNDWRCSTVVFKFGYNFARLNNKIKRLLRR